ncbi:Tn3 family transposase [Nostoc sp. BAE]|nr:Tn3 family transposase [Nostoc commune]MBG1261475.1 Tn3 family transposase [Nostoc commune BAE]
MRWARGKTVLHNSGKCCIKPLLADMTAAKIQHFAAEARVLDASEIKEFNLPKRITLILCLIYSASVMTRDNLVEMFLKKMQLIHNHAKRELELIKQRYQETVEKLLGVFSNVLQVLVDESLEVGTVDKVDKVEQVNQVLLPSGGAEKLLSECEAINAYKGNNYFPLLWQFYKSHRSTFFRLLGALKFSSTTNEQSVVEALNFILENQSRRGQFFNNTIDLDFASPQWQKLLFVEQGNKTKIVRRHLEVCVFSYLMAELRSGDICVKGSENYADHREQLLPWSECLPLINQYCGDLGFANNAVGNVYQLKSLLTDTAMLVDAGYPDNRQLVINDLIQNHWQDILQVVLSIQTGKISSAVLLRKLGNYSSKNRLYQAFQELGRVIRTVFLLQYISDMKLRQQITAATNIVESYNGFSKWFFFGGFGVIANNDPIEQEKIVKYNDLVANAVIFHNVVDLTEVLRDLLKSGYLITREDVAALSPYMTSHIKRFGDYLIDMETVPNLLDDDKLLVLA